MKGETPATAATSFELPHPIEYIWIREANRSHSFRVCCCVLTPSQECGASLCASRFRGWFSPIWRNAAWQGARGKPSYSCTGFEIRDFFSASACFAPHRRFM